MRLRLVVLPLTPSRGREALWEGNPGPHGNPELIEIDTVMAQELGNPGPHGNPQLIEIDTVMAQELGISQRSFFPSISSST